MHQRDGLIIINTSYMLCTLSKQNKMIPEKDELLLWKTVKKVTRTWYSKQGCDAPDIVSETALEYEASEEKSEEIN